MEFLLPLDGQAASDALVDRIEAHFAEHGFGLWAVEIPDTAPFIGMAGLARPSFRPPGTAEVELAWRLARPYWGRGYATEAARAAASYGFDELGRDEVLAVTVPANARSQAVMQRLGMRRDPADDFDHPRVPDGHSLKRHVLYRLKRADWSTPR